MSEDGRTANVPLLEMPGTGMPNNQMPQLGQSSPAHDGSPTKVSSCLFNNRITFPDSGEPPITGTTTNPSRLPSTRVMVFSPLNGNDCPHMDRHRSLNHGMSSRSPTLLFVSGCEPLRVYLNHASQDRFTHDKLPRLVTVRP